MRDILAVLLLASTAHLAAAMYVDGSKGEGEIYLHSRHACEEQRCFLSRATSATIWGAPNEAQTQVHYFGLRYYKPGMGRWVSRDPIGEVALNLNAFVHNEPTSWLDILGREEWKPEDTAHFPDPDLLPPVPGTPEDPINPMPEVPTPPGGPDDPYGPILGHCCNATCEGKDRRRNGNVAVNTTLECKEKVECTCKCGEKGLAWKYWTYACRESTWLHEPDWVSENEFRGPCRYASGTDVGKPCGEYDPFAPLYPAPLPIYPPGDGGNVPPVVIIGPI